MCPHTGTLPGEVRKSVKISSTGEEFPIRQALTCKSKNILYLAGHNAEKEAKSCPTKLQYFGETKQSAQQRCREHKGTITFPCHQDTKAPVGRHFRDSPGHSVADFMFIPVEQIRTNDERVVNARTKMAMGNTQRRKKEGNEWKKPAWPCTAMNEAECAPTQQ